MIGWSNSIALTEKTSEKVQTTLELWKFSWNLIRSGISVFWRTASIIVSQSTRLIRKLFVHHDVDKTLFPKPTYNEPEPTNRKRTFVGIIFTKVFCSGLNTIYIVNCSEMCVANKIAYSTPLLITLSRADKTVPSLVETSLSCCNTVCW